MHPDPVLGDTERSRVTCGRIFLQFAMASLASCEASEATEEMNMKALPLKIPLKISLFSVGETFSNYDDLNSKVIRLRKKKLCKLLEERQ